jgi:hypothetical protein
VSVYATLLWLQHPDEWASDLAEDGIAAGTIGDDSEDRALGSPWVYQGSGRVPRRDDERRGVVEFSVIPEGISPEHGWARLAVNDATVVLDVAQVAALHAVLDGWLRQREALSPTTGDA